MSASEEVVASERQSFVEAELLEDDISWSSSIEKLYSQCDPVDNCDMEDQHRLSRILSSVNGTDDMPEKLAYWLVVQSVHHHRVVLVVESSTSLLTRLPPFPPASSISQIWTLSHKFIQWEESVKVEAR